MGNMEVERTVTNILQTKNFTKLFFKVLNVILLQKNYVDICGDHNLFNDLNEFYTEAITPFVRNLR